MKAFILQVLTGERYKKAVNRMRKYRCPIELDDLVGEFHAGMAKALLKVRPDIGDPVEYLMSYGFHRVRMAIRTECNRKYIQECRACGHERPYDQRPCKCKSKSFFLHPRFMEEIAESSPCAKPFVEPQEEAVNAG